MLDWIKSDFKQMLFSTIIHVNVKLKEAQNQGTHIFTFDKYCRGAKDYFSLSRELIIQEKQTKPPQQLKAPELRPQEATRPQIKPDEISLSLESKMREVLKEKLPVFQEVSFSVTAPQAKEVYLVGDFNNWKIEPRFRMQQENGAWKKKVELTSGRHYYRFVIDGSWTEDTSNPHKQVNSFGWADSVIEVAAAK
jgi:hypothetical protein